MSASCVICVGSINVDFQVRGHRLPRWNEVTAARDLLIEGGGTAANVACFASRAGAASRLVSRVGEDRLAALALGGLGLAGVDLRYTRVKPGVQTGVAMVLTGAGGKTSTVTVPNANAAWADEEAEDVESAILSAQDGSVVVADLETSTEAVSRAMATARRRGFPVIVDPPAAQCCGPLATAADYLTSDARETPTLMGIGIRTAGDGFTAAEALCRAGARHVFVKLPEGSCCVLAADSRFVVSAPRTRRVDAKGAGAAFAAALAMALLERLPLRSAAVLAVAAEAIALSRYGGQLAYPEREELLAFARDRVPPIVD